MVKKGASKVDTAQKKISASLSRFQKIKNENSVIHASKKAEKEDTISWHFGERWAFVKVTGFR